MLAYAILYDILFVMQNDIVISTLFEAGAHVGYSKARRHPKMRKFIFGTRNNIEIFDLERTIESLAKAESFLEEVGKNGGLVLWVGSKPSATSAIQTAAKQFNAPYVIKRWLGGTLTNFKNIQDRLVYWENLEREVNSSEIEKYVKKERVHKAVELRKLSNKFGGLKTLQSLPATIVIVDPEEEKTARMEAHQINIPIVGILNNDCNPENITYPIPANDNSAEAVSYIVQRLAAAYEAGYKINESVKKSVSSETTSDK